MIITAKRLSYIYFERCRLANLPFIYTQNEVLFLDGFYANRSFKSPTYCFLLSHNTKVVAEPMNTRNVTSHNNSTGRFNLTIMVYYLINTFLRLICLL